MRTLWHLGLRAFGFIIVGVVVGIPTVQFFSRVPVTPLHGWEPLVMAWLGFEAVIGHLSHDKNGGRNDQ